VSWRPDWTCPPGETLLELIQMRGWTQAHLARMTGFSLKHINRVIKGHENISVHLALKLESLDMGTAEFWVHRDADYRLDLARGRKVFA
jgi:HTH-type transcriptional regulator/antitoxin HigA